MSRFGVRVPGGALDWQRLDDKRACRICQLQQHGGLQSPEDDWPEIQDQMIERMDLLVRSLEPHMSEL